MTQHNKVRVKARKIWLTALATSTLIALAACTPTTDANPTQPTTTTTTSTTIDEPTQNEASTTPLTPPAYPEGIDEFTEANAIKFVEFYLQSLTFATNTGDTAPVVKFTKESCEWCIYWMDEVSKIEARGSKFEAFDLSTKDTPLKTQVLGDTVVVTTQITQSEYWVVDSERKREGTVVSSSVSRDIAVQFIDGMWSVQNYGTFDGTVK